MFSTTGFFSSASRIGCISSRLTCPLMKDDRVLTVLPEWGRYLPPGREDQDAYLWDALRCMPVPHAGVVGCSLQDMGTCTGRVCNPLSCGLLCPLPPLPVWVQFCILNGIIPCLSIVSFCSSLTFLFFNLVTPPPPFLPFKMI